MTRYDDLDVPLMVASEARVHPAPEAPAARRPGPIMPWRITRDHIITGCVALVFVVFIAVSFFGKPTTPAALPAGDAPAPAIPHAPWDAPTVAPAPAVEAPGAPAEAVAPTVVPIGTGEGSIAPVQAAPAFSNPASAPAVDPFANPSDLTALSNEDDGLGSRPKPATHQVAP